MALRLPALRKSPGRRPAAPGGPAADRRLYAVGLVLFLGTVALFARSLGYGFSNYDDPTYVTGNLHVQGGLSWESLRWAFIARIDFWQPLGWLSHMAAAQIFGARPWGHHLTNILWHAANAVLAFLLMRRLTGAFWTSAFGAALFAWHPLRVESVTWITERKDVMSGFFFLLTLLAYVAYARRRAGGRPARSRYAWTLAAYAAALMCKPVVVVLPGLLLLLDVWPLRRLALPGWWSARTGPEATPAPAARDETPGSLLLEKVPFGLLSVMFAVITIRIQAESGAFTLTVPLAARIANALVSIARYLGMFFWPVDLTVIYPHPGTWPGGSVIAASLLILAITGAAAWRFRPPGRGQPWLLTGWGWFLLMLLPSLGLLQVGFQALADRYTYLPILGLEFGLLSIARTALPVRTPSWLKAGGAVLLLAACAWRTWDQQATWRDPSTMLNHALAVTRNNFAAEAFLGFTRLSEGRVAEAEAHARRAVAINPAFGAGHEALALVRLQQGRVDEAIAEFGAVLKQTPRSATTHRDLGDLFLRLNRLDEAAANYEAALRSKPNLASAYSGLAQVEAMRRDPAAAIANFEKALALEPKDWTLHNEYAGMLATLGRYPEGRRHFETALRLAPQVAQTHLNFAGMLGEAGQTAEAVEQARQAVALQPDDPAAQGGLAQALEQAGRLDEAYAAFDRVARQRPDDARALCGLGRVLLERHQPEEAWSRFEAALKSQPEFGPALVGLALAAGQLGRIDDVVANLQRALRATPGDVTALVMLGDAQARQGQMADAAAQYQEALRLRPGGASVEARLGFALFLLRRPAEAARHWEEALRLDPKIPGLRERIERAQRDAAAMGQPE